MNKKMVVANWKMNPSTYEEAENLVKSVLKYGDKDVVLCPPLIWLTDFSHKQRKVSWGAQDVFYEKAGAYTGEVSVPMLADAGVSYVLVGHSERRAMGETDDLVARKLQSVLDGGLSPILCVGENQRMGDSALIEEKEFVAKQLREALQLVSFAQGDNEPRLVIAYEPVWAISARSGGVADTPESAALMISHIRSMLEEIGSPVGRSLKVLYGGSVNAENVKGFATQEEIDGVLVGGASLKQDDFKKIVGVFRKN